MHEHYAIRPKIFDVISFYFDTVKTATIKLIWIIRGNCTDTNTEFKFTELAYTFLTKQTVITQQIVFFSTGVFALF